MNKLSDMANHWKTRTALVALIALILAHLLALWGFALGLPPAPWGDEARYRETLFGEVLALVWQPWVALSPDAAWPAPAGRWVVPVVALWLAGEAVAHFLTRYLQRLLMTRRGGHAVLLGLCPLAEELMRAWLKAGRPVLVLSPRDEDRVAALRAGAAHVAGHWQEAAALRQAGVAQAAVVACLSAGDTGNIDAAVALARFVAGRRADDDLPLQVLVQVGDPFLRATVNARFAELAPPEKLALRFFSAAQIAVRRLWRDHPPDFWQSPAAPGARLWVFGLTPLAEEWLLATLRLALYRHGQAPVVALVGREAEAFRASLLARWPGAEAAGRLHFISDAAESGEALTARLLALTGAPGGIVFCEAEDGANLAAAMRLCHDFQAAGRPLPPLLVREEQGGSAELRGELGDHPWFFHFGRCEEIAAELLLGENLDAMAVRIHERYVHEALAAGETLGIRRSLQHWPLLPEDLKDDNRLVADHHFVKLRDTGCVLVAGGKAGFAWTAEEVEALSRVEHDRWMTQRVVAGWRYAPVRNDAAREHPDIVPWEALGEDRRELDRAVVRQVPDLLEELGAAVCRQKVVRVRGARTHWAFTAAFDQAVDAVLAEMADGVPETLMLWLEPESALACRLAERLLASGRGRFGCLLDAPAQLWLLRQPTPEIRQRLRALFAAASAVRWQAGDAPLAAQAEIYLSIDGCDLDEAAGAWVIDAAGRIVQRPSREGK